MPIEAVLFDADGVLQQRPRGWKDALGERLGFRGNPDDFLADVYDVETPMLDGRADFTEVLATLLSRWHCRVTLEEALRVWTMLDVDAEITETVRTLRRSGVACHLASNQEGHKTVPVPLHLCTDGLVLPAGAGASHRRRTARRRRLAAAYRGD